MLNKIHLRLTYLFTCITSIILITMSLLYVLLYIRDIKESNYHTFQSNMINVLSNLENTDIISYDWILKLESAESYSFFLYDNDTAFRFVTDSKSEEEILLAEEILSYYNTNFTSGLESYSAPTHIEFNYSTQDKKHFLVGIGIIPGTNSNLVLMILYPLAKQNQNIILFLIPFIFIIIITIIAVFLFSYFYTAYLLKPIEENRKRQMTFIASASHEIKTPVAIIVSAIEAMEKGNEEEKKSFYRIAKKECIRLTLLTADLMTLAGSDAEHNKPELNIIEPDTLLLECYESFLALAKTKNITLKIMLPETTVSKQTSDYNKLLQLLSILIDNAITYTPTGGTVILSLAVTTKELIYSVIDNGIGISDAEKEQVFEQFYQHNKIRNTQNHFGLGLCIAQNIAQKINAKINITDTPGGGATFVVYIPFCHK